MGGLRKLRRTSGNRHYAVEPWQPKRPPAVRKMSEVLLDFARPLLDTVDDDGFKNVIIFAALCWNISFMPEPEQPAQLKTILDELSKSDPLMRPELEAWGKTLLRRKKAFFADERRMVVNYKVVETEDSHRLSVMSTLAKDKPQISTDQKLKNDSA